MKKVMLICNAGMSSSLMAKKVTKYFAEKNEEISVEATTIANSDKVFVADKYNLILISPQIRMKFDEYAKRAAGVNTPIAQVPFQAYAPIPTGVEAMAKLIKENIN